MSNDHPTATSPGKKKDFWQRLTAVGDSIAEAMRLPKGGSNQVDGAGGGRESSAGGASARRGGGGASGDGAKGGGSDTSLGVLVPRPAAASSSSTSTPGLRQALETYVVRAGDTLTSIAIKCGMSVSSVKALNRSASKVLFSGQKLTVHSPSPSPASAAGQPDGGGGAPSASEGDGAASSSSSPSSSLSSAGAHTSTALSPASSAPLGKFGGPQRMFRFAAGLCSQQGTVAGTLAVAPDMVLFEPSLTHALVRAHGILRYQLLVEMRDVINIGAVRPFAVSLPPDSDSSDDDGAGDPGGDPGGSAGATDGTERTPKRGRRQGKKAARPQPVVPTIVQVQLLERGLFFRVRMPNNELHSFISLVNEWASKTPAQIARCRPVQAPGVRNAAASIDFLQSWTDFAEEESDVTGSDCAGGAGGARHCSSSSGGVGSSRSSSNNNTAPSSDWELLDSGNGTAAWSTHAQQAASPPPSPSSHAAAPVPVFNKGARVRVHGLVQNVGHNGRLGTVVGLGRVTSRRRHDNTVKRPPPQQQHSRHSHQGSDGAHHSHHRGHHGHHHRGHHHYHSSDSHLSYGVRLDAIKGAVRGGIEFFFAKNLEPEAVASSAQASARALAQASAQASSSASPRGAAAAAVGKSPRAADGAANAKQNQNQRQLAMYVPKLWDAEGEVRASKLLTTDAVVKLNSVLPSYCRDMHWKLHYDLQTDGVQMSTLYKQCEGMRENIVVVKSNFGDVFGCFASEGWRVGEQHFGNGDCFLFTFKGGGSGEARVGEEVVGGGGSGGAEGDDGGRPTLGPLRVFKWSGQNQEFMLGRKSQIAMGGGGGHFGFYLGEDFLGCSSGRCRTFNNELLTRENGFDCVAVEVWSFTAPRS